METKHTLIASTSADSDQVLEQLIAHNTRKVPLMADSHIVANYHIQASDGELMAGIIAHRMGNWMEVSILWVNDKYQKQGLGKLLLQKVEEEARKAKCVYLRLDTFEFQALDFYKKLGYTVFGQIENPVEEFRHYFLKKDFTY